MNHVIPQFEASYNNQHIVSITPDLKIKIGCEVHKFDYWQGYVDEIGLAHGYSEHEISVYRRFIYAAHLVIEDSIKKQQEPMALVGQHWKYKTYLDDDIYVVSQVDPEHIALISISDGNRWRDPVKFVSIEIYQEFPLRLIAGENNEGKFELVKQSKYYKEGDDD